MFRKYLLVVVWFPATLLLLTLMLVNLMYVGGYWRHSPNVNQANSIPQAPKNFGDLRQFNVASSANTAQVLSASVIAGDARPRILEQYLRNQTSPMTPFTDAIVQYADQYSIDWRLTTAIAMCESNAGKRIPSRDSYNPYGIAVYTGQLSGAVFRDWPHAIEWVSRYIKQKYYDRGVTDLIDIGGIWAPPSLEKGNSWANCVTSFIDDIGKSL
ncbi:MAG: hypothetical protein Q7S76_03715 [bacterium]|nr:hypothetical protein [bacterium]